MPHLLQACIGMAKYDPFVAPDPEEWLATDEQERLDRVQAYHRSRRIRLPNEIVHAVIHMVVENQIAMGEEVPIRTLQRLIAEGLDRHDAIHAIGSVLAWRLNLLMRSVDEGSTSSQEEFDRSYHTELEQLTAKSWRDSG